MIQLTDYFKIGKFGKPRGTKGEISFSFTHDVFEHPDFSFIVCLLEDIPVPFFVLSYHLKSSESGWMEIETIKTEDEAKKLVNKELYVKKELFDFSEREWSWNDFVHFSVFETKKGEIGEVIDVDESTINILLIVYNKEIGEEKLIPINEEFIDSVNWEKDILYLNLPEGLLEI